MWPGLRLVSFVGWILFGAAVGLAYEARISTVYVDGAELVVQAQVPPGFKKFVLESKTRVQGASWQPRSVLRSNTAGGLVTFRIPFSSGFEVLRVRADLDDVLPSSFFAGPSSFNGISTGTGGGAGTGGSLGGQVGSAGIESRMVLFNGTTTGLAEYDSGVAPIQSVQAVVESDIWKITDGTLYFFNQHRGLQIIDIRNPAAPLLRGFLQLPVSGEQMYILPGGYVVLLAGQNACEGAPSKVMVVRVTDGRPEKVQEYQFSGKIAESRLVGTRLYTVSPEYRQEGEPDRWALGTLVSSFDFSNPEAAEISRQYWSAGAPEVVSASDRYLFISRSRDGITGSELSFFELSTGTPLEPAGTVLAAGRVNDKFKIHAQNGVLFVISKLSRSVTTALESFSLANPASPERLDRIEFARNEELHATRFHGDKAYVVTFLRTDPLWIIDLADPGNLRISGELQVPGWSTYIQPLDGKLLTFGPGDNWGNRVAVSLFDVSDPGHPSLIAKEFLGQGWSTSEAVTDEKAFGFFPDAGMLLVPFVGDNGRSKVQIVDFTDASLKLRGTLPHYGKARRASIVGDHILSISASELMSFDASDRESPVEKARLDLSYRVDDVFPSGEYLVQIARSGGSENGAIIRVTTATDSWLPIRELHLGNAPVVGLAQREERLYLLQASQQCLELHFTINLDGEVAQPPAPTQTLTILDLSALPEISVAGKVETRLTGLCWSGEFQPVWPSESVLVFVSGGQQSEVYYKQPQTIRTFNPWGSILINMSIVDVGFQITMFPEITPLPILVPLRPIFQPVLWYPAARHPVLLAYEIPHSSERRFAANLEIIREGAFGFSEPSAANDLVYLSHTADEQILTGSNFWVQTTPYFTFRTNVSTQQKITSMPVTRVETNDYVVEEIRATPIDVTFYTNVFSHTRVHQFVRTPLPVSVSGLLAGDQHLLVLNSDGSAITWGDNSIDQLATAYLSLLPSAISASAGSSHNLILDASGGVWGWGGNMHGQVGPAENNSPAPIPVFSQPVPILLEGLPPIVAAAAGFAHSLALDVEGNVWSWGGNYSGQLGTSILRSRPEPALVPSLDSVMQIAAGREHSIALKADGTVWGWGGNAHSQLPGGASAYTLPVVLGHVPGAKSISAGAHHSLILLEDGAILASGRNAYGALGDGSTESRSTFETVQAPFKAGAIAAGYDHNLALDEDGQVWAWGRNEFGQVLAAEDDHVLLPEPVYGLPPVRLVAAGAGFSVALTETGELWGWGRNGSGQLGSGTTLLLTNDYTSSEVAAVTNYLHTTNIYTETVVVTNTVWVRQTNTVLSTNIVSQLAYLYETNWYATYRYERKSYLDVIDFTEPDMPMLRPPVSVPGRLSGLSHDGVILYTSGPGIGEDILPADYYLHALAYDGTAAFLIDQEKIDSDSPGRIVVDGGRVFVAGENALNVWSIGEIPSLNSVASLPIQHVQSLRVLGGELLAEASEKVSVLEKGTLLYKGVIELPSCGMVSLRGLNGLAGRYWSPRGELPVLELDLKSEP